MKLSSPEYKQMQAFYKPVLDTIWEIHNPKKSSPCAPTQTDKVKKPKYELTDKGKEYLAGKKPKKTKPQKITPNETAFLKEMRKVKKIELLDIRGLNTQFTLDLKIQAKINELIAAFNERLG